MKVEEFLWSVFACSTKYTELYREEFCPAVVYAVMNVRVL